MNNLKDLWTSSRRIGSMVSASGISNQVRMDICMFYINFKKGIYYLLHNKGMNGDDNAPDYVKACFIDGLHVKDNNIRISNDFLVSDTFGFYNDSGKSVKDTDIRMVSVGRARVGNVDAPNYPFHVAHNIRTKVDVNLVLSEGVCSQGTRIPDTLGIKRYPDVLFLGVKNGVD